MKLILDTANLADIRYFNDYYPIEGVTTNPTILSREGGDIVAHLHEIRKIIGPKKELHIQVTETEYEKILDGFSKSINELNIHKSRVNMLSSAEIKKDEAGILELSEKLNIPVNFVEMDKLKLFESSDVAKSEFVYSKFGIYGVCEPSALITAGFDSKLIYKKTSYGGVTISVAVSK